MRKNFKELVSSPCRSKGSGGKLITVSQYFKGICKEDEDSSLDK